MNSETDNKSPLPPAVDMPGEVKRPDAGQIVEGYHHLYDCSCTMLAFAEAGDWTSLVEEEMRYIERLEDLISQEYDVELSGSRQAQKSSWLALIMEQSLEIKRLLAERQQHLVNEAEEGLFESALTELPVHWSDEDLKSDCVSHELQ